MTILAGLSQTTEVFLRERVSTTTKTGVVGYPPGTRAEGLKALLIWLLCLTVLCVAFLATVPEVGYGLMAWWLLSSALRREHRTDAAREDRLLLPSAAP